MAKVYINEYARSQLDSRGHIQVAQEPPVASQVLDTTGTHLSAAMNAETNFVRMHTDGIISYKFGTAPTAATTDARMEANHTEYFGVMKGTSLKIDVIANT